VKKVKENEFRVYDHHSRMYPPEQHKFFVSPDGTLIFLKNKRDITVCDPDRYTIEWYTGQQDTQYPVSKGPVYERDVLGQYYGDEEQRCGHVEYDNDIQDFVIHKENGGWERLHEYLAKNKVGVIKTTHEERNYE
jgi:hypothetical protein